MAYINFGWVKILPPPHPKKRKEKSLNSVGILHDPRPEGGGKELVYIIIYNIYN